MLYSSVSIDTNERRKARAKWQAQVFRAGQEEEMEQADAEFWTHIPLHERLAFAWQLSHEMFYLTQPKRHERRLPRSAFRVMRRPG
jgi:hypothetical protein